MQPKTKCNERLSRPISTPKPTIHAVFAIFQLDPSKPTRALERGTCPTPAVNPKNWWEIKTLDLKSYQKLREKNGLQDLSERWSRDLSRERELCHGWLEREVESRSQLRKSAMADLSSWARGGRWSVCEKPIEISRRSFSESTENQLTPFFLGK